MVFDFPYSPGLHLTRPTGMFSSKSDKMFSVASNESVQVINTPATQYGYKPDQNLLKSSIKSAVPDYKLKIVWRNVIIFAILHLSALYGFWLAFTRAMWSTTIFAYVYGFLTGISITGGAHRLWAHRSYKAKLPLRIVLMIFQCGALQNSIYEWARDHRVHHKFTDTNADPHNSQRGFFFSHVGWLMVKKHKDVITKGKSLDLSDLEADAVVMFQKRHYLPLALTFCFIIPIFTPWYFWGESWMISWYVAGFWRYATTLNYTWLVNSAAHLYGSRPYDKTINPRENKFVAWAALGEGWHNYHHVFPWDYKAAELGNYRLNFTTAFLDFMAKIGWAYDLKSVTPEMVTRRIQKTGDGSDKDNNNTRISNITVGHDHQHPDNTVWGWGDEDMEYDDIEDVKN